MSSSVSNEEIFRSIGNLDAKVERLIEDQRRSDDRSEESRRRIYEAQGEMREELKTVQTRVTSLEGGMAPLSSLAKKADEWENRGKGALAAAGMIGGAAMAALIYFKDRILAAVFPGS